MDQSSGQVHDGSPSECESASPDPEVIEKEHDAQEHNGHGANHTDQQSSDDSNDVSVTTDDVIPTVSVVGESDPEVRIDMKRDHAPDDASVLYVTNKKDVLHNYLRWQKDTEQRYDTIRKAHGKSSYASRRAILLVSYLLGIAAFAVFFHLPRLPGLPFPVVNNLEDWNPVLVPYIWWPSGTAIVELLWVYTHLRRSVFIMLTAFRMELTSGTHRDRMRSSPERDKRRLRRDQRVLGACALFYHVIFGAWLGWANNPFSGYLTSDRQFVISGLVAYLVGELVITIGDGYYLYRKSVESEVFRKFRLAGEIFIWAGFGLVSFTLPAVFVFLIRFAILTFLLYVPERPSCI